MREEARTYTFENGLRLMQIPSPTQVAYCGISIDAGTRDEEPGEEGMAHFCEHMMFKGTDKRRAWHIINRMEAVGGDLNAYTNKEETVVYAAFMKEHLERATELIFDIVFHSTFPQHEIDKECEVIVDEIESYNDTPADLIFDRFEDIIYEGNSLGHDILGTAENVRRFRTEDALQFVLRLYRPEKMVFFVLGDVEFEQVKKMVGKRLKDIKSIIPIEPIRLVSPIKRNAGIFTEERGTHQAHVMIGRASYGSEDDKRIALYFLNNILGGPGMNSRLNIALREHKGLVYTVESSLTNYTDTSTWAIYFGCDEEDVERCLRTVRQELDKLMNEPMTERQFTGALKQIKGQIGVACDNFENYALDMAKAYLHYNKVEGQKDTIEHLERLTPELLQEVAREVFDEQGLTTLIFR
ncbi:MAG: insulinase family protein [Bacteroidaceae bacterium]|nr:insulinase family protein [Bacteroidaceae bacterium]MBR3619660.1 insulinase family protein [Bacteroidaceae bacterium]